MELEGLCVANTYDYQAVFNAARKVEQVANKVKGYQTGNLRRIGSDSDKLKGETAKALDEVTGALSDEAGRIYSGFSKCADMLYQYAKQLKEADEKSKQLISKI